MASVDDESKKSKSRKIPGCAVMLGLIGLALLGGGVALMGWWDAMGGSGKSGAIILLVLGTVLLLPLVLFAAIFVFIAVFLRKLKKSIGEMGDLGSKMLGDVKAMYGQEHEFRPATDDDFAGLDRAYYDGEATALEARGFIRLGDLVDDTIAKLGNPSPPIRVMSSPDRSTTVAVYNLRMPSAPVEAARDARVCDVTTEFTDGTFLMSSNTQGLDTMTPPPAIVRRHHPVGTPVADVLGAHEADRVSILESKSVGTGEDEDDGDGDGADDGSDGSVACVTINTLADALASERRQQAVKNAFRAQIGYLSEGEVREAAKAVADPDDEDGQALSDIAANALRDAKRRDGQG